MRRDGRRTVSRQKRGHGRLIVAARESDLLGSNPSPAVVAPNGVEFTIAFFSTAEEASAAAGMTEGSTAVAYAVVTPAGKRLAASDLATIEECVRGG